MAVSTQAIEPVPKLLTPLGTFAQADTDRSDLMMHYGSVNFDMHTYRQGCPTADNVFCLTPNVTHAWSRGTSPTRRATTCGS